MIDLDAEALAGAKDDGEDLRLYDATGAEIPYAFRVLRDVQTSERRAAEEFNRSTTGDIAAVTLDLGDKPGAHNQIGVATAGANYRWRAAVQCQLSGATASAKRKSTVAGLCRAGRSESRTAGDSMEPGFRS